MKAYLLKNKVRLFGALSIVIILVVAIVLSAGRKQETRSSSTTNVMAENDVVSPALNESSNDSDDFMSVSELLTASTTSKPFQDTLSKANTARALIARKLAEGAKPNRLIKEKSPYLLQHAFNPVDWYPWGEEAFAKARKEDKPIFLSVGYSTCYWCHVMEREVFENESIAALMNQYVVSIKVDREERPDVDRVYMTALQAMTGGGGWPMSMFITPDLKPFYGGTYIPPVASYGRPGFPEILTRIHEVWTTRRQDILNDGQKIVDYLKQVSTPQVEATQAGKLALERGFDSYSRSYDAKYAGFGKAPKFPRPVSFNFLFRYYSRTGEKKALDMSLETLKQMARGGMYDHIGGGFHRYATDTQWHVPHFEKMLYDQAQLVVSYLEAYQITHEEFYAEVARDVLAYVLRNMTHPRGGFYSAEDAESAVDPTKPEEKEEGAFYTWIKNEIDGVLAPEQAKVFNYHYGVKQSGNVTSDPHQEFVMENILFVAHTPEETAKQFGHSVEKVKSILSASREKLFRAREKRPKPHLDDKILVSWNGLMISAFVRAHQVLGDEKYLQAAERAGQFILDNLYDAKGKKLLRRYREGEPRYEAHLEDYAFLTQGLLDLYEAGLDIRRLQTAIALTEQQNELFYDQDQGGFYDISGADKSILMHTKEWYDGAEPTGNAIAILNLLRLSQMTDNKNWRAMADQSLAYFGGWMLNTPQGLAQFLVALDFSLSKPKQIIIAGKANDPNTRTLLEEVHSRFIPNKIILLADNGKAQETLASYIPFIESVQMLDGKATAYICENYACRLPTSDREVVAKLLAN
ncbi:thioredoxin domain-containing protein [candidate division KSB1 bacterium]|nr:thioredoxin domain-containing protein [candidate division KSB1 bacterium]